MECNRDEAIRAKGIAEQKMESKDFVGARRIAIKAQRLYPDLEHISQIICLCDVHCPAENRNLGNEKDWYDILKVEQSADEVSIKKQYRKLALLLHPDKNKFSGAEAAFLLIGEAQKVLLDREKRSLFDARYRRFSQNTTPNPPPPPANKNASNVKPPSGQTNATKKASSRVKKQPQQQATNVKPPSGQTNTTQNASPQVKKQPEQQANNMKPPSGQTNTTQNATSHVKSQPQQQANNVKPPSGQTNTTQNASARVKKQPQRQENKVKPPSGQTNTAQNASAQVKNQPQQQANNVKPPSGQTNMTQNASSHVKKQPQQQANNAKPPSGQTNTTKNASTQVKKQPQQQANNVKPPSGQTNTTQNASSHVKKQSRQQAISGVSSGSPTFQAVCPFCLDKHRFFRYYLNRNRTCARCTMNFIAYEIRAESTTPQSNANQTATRARVVSNQGVKCSASNSRSQGNSGQPPPGRNANQTATHPQGVNNQGGSSSVSNGRLQGNSGQQKPGVDSVTKPGKTAQVESPNKTSELNMGATKISRTTSGGSIHSRTSIGKAEKKPVEPGGGFQSKGATSSKDAVAGSGCEGDSSNHQRSPQLKRHVSYDGIGSDDGALNSSKRLKTNAPSVLSHQVNLPKSKVS